MTRASPILGKKNLSSTRLQAGRGLNFPKENGTLGRQLRGARHEKPTV